MPRDDGHDADTLPKQFKTWQSPVTEVHRSFAAKRTSRARRQPKPQRGDTYQPRATPWVLVGSPLSPEGA